ncbi:DUF2849 domain-containing protein [Rhodobacteraceae bacterium CCMM004]|nr:DUF2849 domain-containing protein [Rhodobacteraceae bacterium CCMM004]
MSRRPFAAKIVTANCLRSGEAVWLTADDRWSPDMADAELIEDEAVADDRLLFALAQGDRVVGAYLADARPGRDGPEPVHFREAFRTRGPSNHVHGKQERRV